VKPSITDERKPLTRSRAWGCVAINQLAFPGMGTVMAGLRIGYAQAAIMLAGFFLTMGFMICYFTSVLRLLTQLDSSDAQFEQCYRPYAWAGIYGLALCVIAWFWALFSSITILRNAVAVDGGVQAK